MARPYNLYGQPPNYLPSEREIAEKTAEIRESWTEEDYRQRAGLLRNRVELLTFFVRASSRRGVKPSPE